MNQRVAVALSGGVDSLVTAWLLKKQGYQVQGLHFWNGFEGVDGEINLNHRDPPLARIRQRMARLGEALDIPMEVLDYHVPFKTQVVDYFVRAYSSGKTPNPCVVCNKVIKFGALLKHARQMGASCLATGHYARVSCGKQGDPCPPENESASANNAPFINGPPASPNVRLLKGLDPQKDQSYFLSRLTTHQLQQACFPLGTCSKAEVRALANRQGLQPLHRAESQDVCFVAGGNYHAFLKAWGLKSQSGEIVDTQGQIVGEHSGLAYFTIGQRRGINCPAAEPYYVLAMDQSRNRLIVGFKSELYSAGCRVEKVQWLQVPLAPETAVHVRLRYRHQGVPATIIQQPQQQADVIFKAPQASVTPGQCAVFYRHAEVLGSGWIVGAI